VVVLTIKVVAILVDKIEGIFEWDRFRVDLLPDIGKKNETHNWKC
jgi:hypothetical protein